MEQRSLGGLTYRDHQTRLEQGNQLEQQGRVVFDFLLCWRAVGEVFLYLMGMKRDAVPYQEAGMIRPHDLPKNGSGGFTIGGWPDAGTIAAKRQLAGQ